MSAIDQLFQELRSRNEKAFIPFVTGGDPDIDFTRKLLLELSKRGCHLCEVGIPYSDPIADGPVIQASYTRALERNIRVADILEMLSRTTASLSTPTVTMVSYAIVHRMGPQRFVDMAKESGVRGAIIPDLLHEESEPMVALCRREDFSLIQLVTPTTTRDRALRIAETSSGFLYYVSVTGITGERTELPAELSDKVGWLREQTELPICIGFGISQPDHVRLLAGVADGLIVGSAIVRRIARADSNSAEAVIDEVGEFVATLISAMKS